MGGGRCLNKKARAKLGFRLENFGNFELEHLYSLLMRRKVVPRNEIGLRDSARDSSERLEKSGYPGSRMQDSREWGSPCGNQDKQVARSNNT